MTLATCSILCAIMTYATIALREIVMWRFPDSDAARWLERRDPTVQLLVARLTARAPQA